MLFDSISFAVFFPIFTFLYFVVPGKMQWKLMLLASIVFYMSFIPKYILVMLILILINYIFAIFIERSNRKKKLSLLILSLTINIGFLGFFKYFNFFTDNLLEIGKFFHWNYSLKSLSIILPLGLSFQIFQLISYVIEVFRGRKKPEKSLGIFALYIMFYPKLIAGPIERPQHLIPQIKKAHRFDYKQVVEGLRLMLWGFFLKLVIADRLANFANVFLDNPSGYQGLPLIIATVFFSFQIYTDFAGYTNIARGCAKVMGIDLIENFNKPYFATSVQDFWRRWHMSLSSWFRDYLYIPLGGSRGKLLNTLKNIIIVFIITGLWHGANWTFIFWGLLHGTFIACEQILKRLGLKLQKPLNIITTFILVSFAWIFFRSENLSDAKYIIFNLFQFRKNSFGDMLLNRTEGEFVIDLLLIFFILFYEGFENELPRRLFKKSAAFRWTVYYVLVLAILFIGIFSWPKFIYFQF